MKKLILTILCFQFLICLFAQEEDLLDLTFKKPNTYGEKRVKIQFSTQLNISTIWGNDATSYRNALDSLRQASPFDVLKIGLLTGAQIEVIPEIIINKKLSFLTGVKFSHLGWKEVAKDRINNANYQNITVRNDLLYFGISYGFRYNFTEGFSIQIQRDELFLGFQRSLFKDVRVINNNKDVETEVLNFEEVYEVALNRYVSMFNLSFQIKIIENLYLTNGIGLSTNFINRVNFRFATIQTGFIFKL